ncbi:hypothetical protein HJG60_008382 [Phyllostomus discolor]|uniref:Uncharacterized protein n=1 Tax=Phyllostomus discolor TaxID=89673 RepID=A0A833Z8B0_9CHIR|nr:hypothetical protein HJG60_008382 [Phyllostomus discolor]
MPTLKGTEASLSYVQCFLYLVSSSVNVSIFILQGWIPSGQTSYIWGRSFEVAYLCCSMNFTCITGLCLQQLLLGLISISSILSMCNIWTSSIRKTYLSSIYLLIQSFTYNNMASWIFILFGDYNPI